MKKILHIDGMMCAHCKMNVEKALLTIDGVTSAEVDLDDKCAVVSLSKDIEESVFEDVIEGIGFDFISSENI